MDPRHKGGCLCGAVRYEIKAEPAMSGLCCCLSCQKLSGSGHAFHAMIPEVAFAARGELRAFDWKADSGSVVTTSFCPVCGVPISGRSSGMPGMVTFRVATLDDPSGLHPQMAVFAKRLQPWDMLDPALARFPEMPPMPKA